MTRRPAGTPAAPGARDAGRPADPATVTPWRARLDALTRWCLADLPLAPDAAAAAASLRPTLGDLLRRALGRAGDGVVDLLDALDAPADPTARARLSRVLGGDVLLVVVTARDGAIVRADARACRTGDEARALVSAFLGRAAPPWAADGGVCVRGPEVAPLLAYALDGGPLPHGAPDAGDAPGHILVLPFLTLDGRVPEAPPEAERFGLPAAQGAATHSAPTQGAATHSAPTQGAATSGAGPLVFGGVLRPGAAFLDAAGVGEAAQEDDADTQDAGTQDADIQDADDSDAGDDDARHGDARHDAQAAHARGGDAAGDAAGDEDADDAPHDEDAFLHAFAFGPSLGRGVASAAPALDAPDEADDPEPAAAPDPSVALERLRRRTAPVERVPAVIATDDGVAEHVGDAVAWLAEASEQELRALARGGWTGDTAIELALAADDPEIDDVARQARRHEAELVVEIDGEAAVAWLRRHRPETAERLAAVL